MHQPPRSGEPPALPPLERLQELLFDACRLGRDDMVPVLIEAGADAEAGNDKGHTPLILASYNGHASITGWLLQHGVDADRGDSARGNTALMGVAFKGYEPIVRLLIDNGAAVDQRNHAGQTALMNAAMFGHTAIVDLLLAHGADPLASDAAGNSAASVAVAQRNDAMVARIHEASGT